MTRSLNFPAWDRSRRALLVLHGTSPRWLAQSFLLLLALSWPCVALAQPPRPQAPAPATTADGQAVRELPLPRPLAQPVSDLASRLKTLAGRPAEPRQALALGVAQALSGQHAEAARTLASVPRALPEMADWAGLYLGLALFKQGEFQKALAALDEAFALRAGDGQPSGQTPPTPKGVAPRPTPPSSATLDGSDQGASAPGARSAPAPTPGVTASPLAAEALLLSAYCLEGLGSPLALERYRRFLENDHAVRAVALWRAAAVAASAGRDAEAVPLLRELILTQPWTASAEKAETLAASLLASGRSDFDPDAPESLRQRIEALLDKSQNAKALALAERLAARPGADQARALYLKAKALHARRETQTAVQLFEDAARTAADPTLAAWAVYHQARSLWRFAGAAEAARMEELLLEALTRARGLPGGGADLAEASHRLLMLSRLERARFAPALESAQALAAQGPEPTEAREQARLLAGIIPVAQGDYGRAVTALTAFLERFGDSESAPAAHYWLGRARFESGDRAGALAAWETVLTRWPNGYYGMLASRRVSGAPAGASASASPGTTATPDQPVAPGQDAAASGPASVGASGPSSGPTLGPASVGASGPASGPASGSASVGAPGSASGARGVASLSAASRTQQGQTVASAPPACPGSPAPVPAPELRAAHARADILEAGLFPELAERELSAAQARQPRDQATALRLGGLSTRLGNHLQAVRAVSRAFAACLARGARQDLLPLRHMVYPAAYQDIIQRALAGSGLDPDIILGLIRQESFFEPEAVSGAGAVGLMQLLPATARDLAARLGEKGVTAESLKDPALNVRLGVRYFLDRHAEFAGNLPLTLASYNAGRVKVGVWREFLGGLDPELFTEFIPYTETRDYVKRIQANQAMYALLYR